jgi:hypothetical protein
MGCRARESGEGHARFRNVLIGFSIRRLQAPVCRTRCLGVSEETRARLVREIDEKNAGQFTLDAVTELDERNPALLQVAHSVALRLGHYLQAMQGFALLYRSLALQSRAERGALH